MRCLVILTEALVWRSYWRCYGGPLLNRTQFCTSTSRQTLSADINLQLLHYRVKLIRAPLRSWRQEGRSTRCATFGEGGVAGNCCSRSSCSCRHSAERETCRRVTCHHTGSTRRLTGAIGHRARISHWQKNDQDDKKCQVSWRHLCAYTVMKTIWHHLHICLYGVSLSSLLSSL